MQVKLIREKIHGYSFDYLFEDVLNKMIEEGWQPVWETFTVDNQHQFCTILVQKD